VEELIQAWQKEYYDALGAADAQADSAGFVELILEIIGDTLRKINVAGRHSTDQNSDQDIDQDNAPINRLLSALGNDTLSAAELMKRLHLSHKPTFRKSYLHPSFKQGLIERTLPDQPSSKN
jgi:fic family protein